jgi:hypothetical protein
MTPTSFETFLMELAKVLQFSSLAPDAHGACLIVMKEDSSSLLFEFDDQLVPNTILLSCPIIPIPIDHRAAIYEAALIGNNTIEDTLSVKPDEDTLFLHSRFHPSIQAAEIEKILYSFLKNVKLWKSKVETISKEPPSSSQMPPHPSSIQVFPYKA